MTATVTDALVPADATARVPAPIRGTASPLEAASRAVTELEEPGR